MSLDYGSLLSPVPIELSIGTLRHPKLIDIAKLTFHQFEIYQLFLKIKPIDYYLNVSSKEGSKEYWNALPEVEQLSMTMYDVLLDNESVAQIYTDIFNFFFENKVLFTNNCFILLKDSDTLEEAKNVGVINESNFRDALNVICEICNIAPAKDEKPPKFKNEKAKRLYYRMEKAKQEEARVKRTDLKYKLENIISSVASKSPNLSMANIWDITLYQLYDQFTRLQIVDVYERQATSVSVWGDEKKKFDPTQWFKSIFGIK